MAFPKTIDEMLEQGYQFMGRKTCGAAGCRAELAMYRTPKDKIMPMNATGRFVPHFTTCPAKAAFRKAKPETKPLQQRLF
jgi:hypothetical protein